ncbi:hypothetical protein [Bifidobacterium callitrichidarum]|uniref:hypothetical protein n=1 Tax=Bifidobacterium callitrichidarum TaxID=2052941 RepID=UPI0011B1F6E1|nr:hypothetical protein [Bifidobacterium callitrichidarum]
MLGNKHQTYKNNKQEQISDAIGRKLSIILFAFMSSVFIWWLYCSISYFGTIVSADPIETTLNTSNSVIEQHRILTNFGALTIIALIGLATVILFSAKIRIKILSLIRFLAFHPKSVFIVMLCWQFIIIICYIPAHLRYDARTAQTSVVNAIAHPGIYDSYLSTYPNNAFLYLIEYIPAKILSVILDDKFTMNEAQAVTMVAFFMQLINIATVDISILLMKKIIKPVSEYASKYAYLLMVLLLGCSTWVIIPYTDTFSLIPTMWLLSLIIHSLKEKLTRHPYPLDPKTIIIFLTHFILIGIASCFAYSMKPSSVIPLIAFLIIWFFLHLGKQIITYFIPSLLSIIIGFGIILVPLHAIEHTIFNYNENQSVPMTHYIMMGMKDHGRYNTYDYKQTTARSTIEEKKQYNLSVIQQRLNSYGPGGYLSFLLKKSYYNTADGTFSDNSYLTVLNEQKGTGWIGIGKNNPIYKYNVIPLVYIQNFLTDGEDSHQIYEIIMQMIYIITIFGMLSCAFALYKKKENLHTIALEAWIMLTILGGYTFLLLFEAGRSRYIIQFLPFIFFLSALGWNHIETSKICVIYKDINHKTITSILNKK